MNIKQFISKLSLLTIFIAVLLYGFNWAVSVYVNFTKIKPPDNNLKLSEANNNKINVPKNNSKIINYAYLHQNLLQGQKYVAKLSQQLSPHFIIVDVATQTLTLYQNNQIKQVYPISTSKRGLGQEAGSRKTPVGLHRLCEKIGDNTPEYAIFKGRKFTGNIWPQHTPRHQHRRDYIVTRILRLEGLEVGLNSGSRNGKNVDSKARAIYIHGTTMDWKLGTPATIGCVHLSSKDIIKLFNHVPIGSLVWIK